MNKSIKVLKLPVSFLKEGKRYVAFSPVLDLSTSGRTLKQARERFIGAVELFFDELAEMGTTEEVLLGLGWARKNKDIVPPEVVAQKLESIKVFQTH